MAKKKGPLYEKLEPRRMRALFDVDEERRNARIQQWADEDHKKLLLLCDELGIPDGPSRWYELALELARKQYLGFQERRPTKKWTFFVRARLFVEIERLTADRRKHPAHTARWAAGLLAKTPEWKEFLGGEGKDDGEALRVQYQKVRKNREEAEVARKLFQPHVDGNPVAE